MNVTFWEGSVEKTKEIDSKKRKPTGSFNINEEIN